MGVVLANPEGKLSAKMRVIIRRGDYIFIYHNANKVSKISFKNIKI